MALLNKAITENEGGSDGSDGDLFLSQIQILWLELDAQFQRHLAIGLFLRVVIRNGARELARVRVRDVVVRVIEVLVVEEIRYLTGKCHLPLLSEREGLGYADMMNIEALSFEYVHAAIAEPPNVLPLAR